MKILTSFIICIAAIIGSCSTPQQATLKGDFKITLGSGGGVSGFYSEYHITQDGQVIRKNFDSETPRLIKTMDKSQARDLYLKLVGLDFKQTTFDCSGNINYYIELTDNSGSHKVKWGKPCDKTPPTAITAYYDEVMKIITAK